MGRRLTSSTIVCFAVWLIATTSGVSSKNNWYNWTCNGPPPPGICTCRPFNDTYRCSIRVQNDSQTDRNEDQVVNCSETSVTPLLLSIECSKFWDCVEVDIDAVYHSFYPLKRLYIDNCHIRYHKDEGYENASIKYQTHVHWRREEGGDVAISTNIEVHWPELLDPNSESCSLINLEIKRSRFFRLPISLIRRCHHLISLSLVENYFYVLDDIDFATLSQLKQLKYIRITNNYLQSFAVTIPDRALDGIQQVLSNEFVDWIEDRNFTDSTMKSRLLEFGRKFQHWDNDTLPLTYNYLIDTIAWMNVSIDLMFGNMPVQVLRLDGNKYKSIPLAFLGLPGLRELTMNNNELFRIFYGYNHRSFYGVRNSLESLSLKRNRIKALQAKTFRYLTNLKFLDLSYNDIYFIDRNIFGNDRLPAIQYINLGHNKIQTIEIGNDLHYLWSIDLNNNRLTSLDCHLTQNLRYNIKEIYLKNNMISSFESGCLQNLEKLSIIDLSNNTFSTLPFLAFQTNERSTSSDRVKLNITRNSQPILCNCMSVFYATSKEMTMNTNGYYEYPEIDMDYDTECYGLLGHNETLRSPRDGDQFLCYYLKMSCLELPGKNCTCCDYEVEEECSCRFICPKGCLCSEPNDNSKHYVNCSNRGMDYVPVSLTLSNATNIYLDGNNLRYLSYGAFPKPMPTVEFLYLNSSSIRWISRKTFHNFMSLIVLFLQDNLLTHINNNVFDGLKSLTNLYLQNNHLYRITMQPFQVLINNSLAFLDLRNNPFDCNCEEFYTFIYDAGQVSFSGSADILLPQNCVVTPSFSAIANIDRSPLPLPLLKPLCMKIAERKAVAQDSIRRRLTLGISLGTTLCLVVFSLVLMFYYKYKILVFADKRLRSALSRALLGRLLNLPSFHKRPYDVGFLVHERQSQHYSEMRRQLRSTTRHNLRIFRIAQHMPGAMRLCQTQSLLDQMAVCVVLISNDLLDDPLFVQELHLILSHNLQRRGTALDVVLVLLNKNVSSHDQWSDLSLLLKGYVTLVWGSHFFWERFVIALPPPTETLPQTCEEATPLLHDSQVSEVAHICVISHENQVGSQVRQLFDQFHDRSHVCHVRHERVFGSLSHYISDEELTLDCVVGSCTQIIMLVSLELLDDEWVRQEVIPSLTIRSTRLPFRGSIILVDINSAITRLCSRREYQFFADFRDRETVISLRWTDIEQNWSLLTRHLLTDDGDEFHPDRAVASLDEAEFESLLMIPIATLKKMESSDGPSQRIFHQNRANWSRSQQIT